MYRILVANQIVHRLPYLPSAVEVHEIANIDSATVDELTTEALILHQSAKQARVLIPVGPGIVFVIVRVIQPLDGIVAHTASIETQSEVGILDNDTPSTALCLRLPPHYIVAREVEIAEEEIEYHDIHKLPDIHYLVVFLIAVAMSLIEIHESLPLVIVAFLQFIPVFDHVDVFETVVVGIDIVLVASLANIENSLVLAVEEEDGRTPCLPVDIDILSHDALYHCIAHI